MRKGNAERLSRGDDDDAGAPLGASPADEERRRAFQLGAFTGQLLDAMFDHDARAIRLLLRRPLAASLPREVREEALAFTALPETSMRAPLAALQFAYRLRQLEDEAPDREARSDQTELFGRADSEPDPER